MAVTLSEAALFTTNMVKKGVLMTIIKDSVVLQKLPFTDVVGNALQYLQENTLGSGTFYDPGDIWVEQTPTFTQKTAVLRIMGGDADVDNFVAQTRSDKTDLTAEVISARAKGIKHTFLDRFYYGNNSVNAKEFDGLHVLIPAAQQVHAGAGTTGAALSLATHLEPMIDSILDGPPDCLLMSKTMRRRLTQYIRKNGGLNVAKFSEFGQRVMEWDNIPIYAEDFILQTEAIASGAYSAKTGGVTTTIFAVRFGQKDLMGLQSGSLQTYKMGQLESKDANRWRIKWYVSLALLRSISAGDIDGLTDAAVGD